MPIKGVSEVRRLPRLGKIHLGFKDPKKKGAPTATDFFVCPSEVQAVFGKEPRELNICFPVDDEERFSSQYYRCYSQTQGLVCKGDGETCVRMVDVETDALANRESKETELKELPCEGRECPYYEKQCREVMNLQFLLPEVPGLGIWQIDTSSINSIRNINSAVDLIKRIHGRIAMIPLSLTIEPQEVQTPEGKRRTVNVLNLRSKQTLIEMIQTASTKKLTAGAVELPAPDDEAPEAVEETEPELEPPAPEEEELFPEEPKKKPEPEKSIPQTIQALYNWIISHGKKYTRTWFLENFSYTEEELRNPEKVKAAYYEVKELAGWET